MAKRSLFWQVFPSLSGLLLLALAVSSWFIISSIRDSYVDHMVQELHARTALVRDQISQFDFENDPVRVDSLCKRLGHASNSRITVILPTGIVIGDTDDDPAVMEDHSDRPEIRQAMTGEFGTASRYSHTLQKSMMYVALPMHTGDRLIGVVRTSVPIEEIEHSFGAVYSTILGGLLAIAAVAALASFIISRRISQPLVRMRSAAERYARGETDFHFPPGGSYEISELARTMNIMAVQLDEKIRTITQQRNERDAILASMVEGVIAIDTSERIISLNRAASLMLGLNQQADVGRFVQEVVRVYDFQHFAAGLLRAEAAQESQFKLAGSGRVVQAIGSPLRDEVEELIGAVIVLHDITRLHLLEAVRQDFVANVSHELRTPITSIKGFIETLRDGGVADPAQAQRFLDIIARQADRLNSIVSDLLTLSELEQSNRAKIGSQPTLLAPVLQSAIELVQQKAGSCGISVSLLCDPAIVVEANPPLLEQAVVNLLDNAIKYSDSGSSVEIEAGQHGAGVTINVTDHGCGIEKEYLPRLFERFYRVDLARSRELGGTGLGLSIVKHIVSVHGGDVAVKSTPGKGSTFTIILPVIRLQSAR